MFSEFFCNAQLQRRFLAYLGLLVLMLMGLMLALLDAFVNSWYGQFYSLAGDAANVIMAANFSTSNVTEVLEARDKGLADVARLMWSFSIVVFPAQILYPIMEFVNQHFAFSCEHRFAYEARTSESHIRLCLDGTASILFTIHRAPQPDGVVHCALGVEWLRARGCVAAHPRGHAALRD